MRIVVDWDLCEANAVCVKLAPRLFRINEQEEKLKILVERPDENERAVVEKAVRMCPRGALTLEEV